MMKACKVSCVVVCIANVLLSILAHSLQGQHLNKSASESMYQVLWKRDRSGDIWASATADHLSVLIGSRKHLRLLSTEGELKWERPFEFTPYLYSSFLKNAFFVPCNNELHALSFSGEPLWSISGVANCSSPAVGNDTIYFSGNGSLHACDLDGRILWNIHISNGEVSAPVIDELNQIYVTAGGSLYATSMAGQPLWTFQGRTWSSKSPPILDEKHQIYFASGDKLHAIRSDGIETWSFEADGRIWSTPVINSSGAICFGSMGGKFYAVDNLGKKLWEYSLGYPCNSSAAIDSTDNIYVADGDSFLSLTSEGFLRWRLRTGKLSKCEPIITEDGLLLFNTFSGTLYCLNIFHGPSNSAWPMHRRNSKNSAWLLASPETIQIGTYSK